MLVVPRIHTELACRTFSVAAPSTSVRMTGRLKYNVSCIFLHLLQCRDGVSHSTVKQTVAVVQAVSQRLR